MDDGASGPFTLIFESNHQTFFSVAEGIERGKYYRFRYRARNIVGRSDYSDVAYIQAIESPTRPSAPTFVSASDTSITIGVLQSTDSRGIDVASYEVFID
jgi:hypothetical protein